MVESLKREGVLFMDLEQRLALSYYRTAAVINESHKVYLVQHRDTGEFFVKKILDVYNRDVYDYLYHHPAAGTPAIVCLCEEEGELTVIEEFVSGKPLQEKIKAKDLGREDVLAYMSDLCSILEKLHGAEPPIIHRDIKPSNILITSYNRAVLLDFNAAKFHSSDSKEDTVLLGTRGYAAPEQYGFGSSSPQTDIYSLGVILKEMAEALGEPAEDIIDVAERCTRLDPSGRFQTVSEVKDALKGERKESAVEEKESQIPQSPLRFLPPGFRTLTPRNMVLALPVYGLIFYLCLTLETGNTYGAGIWLERIILLAMMLSVIAGCFDYLGIQSLFTPCRSSSRLVRCLGIALLVLSMVSMLLVILILVEGFIFPAPA
jgi:predicted Ser/Thr protein kinase